MVITDKLFIPKTEVNRVFTLKSHKDWSDDETKKASYDLKARNILIFALSVKVYYSISHHKTPHSMWNDLQVLYEGIEYVKESNLTC